MKAVGLAVTTAVLLCLVQPAMAQCADLNEFNTMSALLNEACCVGPGADCTLNIPSSCPGNCASVLLPLRTACGDFLKGDGALFKNLIDSAADQCAEAPAPQAGGAELCRSGGLTAADGGCDCDEGFFGAHCEVAGPHPAVICALPATHPDDGGKLSALKNAEALFGRLSFKGCFADEDGCACLARNNLCDEMRGLLYLPAGAPGLDDACGVSCAAPLTAAGAPSRAARSVCTAWQLAPSTPLLMCVLARANMYTA
jgi:hypothetical protein